MQDDDVLDLIDDLRHAVVEFRILPQALDRWDDSATHVSGTWPPRESAKVLAAWFVKGWLEFRRPFGLDRGPSEVAGPPGDWEVLTPDDADEVLSNPGAWRNPPFDVIRLAPAATAPVDPNVWFSEAI